ncbi:integrase [Lysinibacillus sp. K60]|nr:integrase [Lysinibacillus sp. K60]
MLIKDLLKEFTFALQIKNYSIRTTETYNYNTAHFIQYLKKYIQHQLILGKKATYLN